MKAHSRHIPELDGLRGIAILLVIPHNVDEYAAAHGWLAPFSALAHAGWIGVQLFFVLSGFLITNNLIDSRGAPNYFSAFFGRRVLRIFPLYFLTLGFFLLLLPNLVELSANILDSYQNQVWLWLFLSNWVQPFGKSVYWFPHFWSLAVEEQFYLVWPFVVALLPDRRLALACIALIIAAFAIRVGMLLAGADPEEMYLFTICRMDALAFGALTAILLRRPALAMQVRGHGTLLTTTALGVILAGAAASHIYGVHDPVTITVGYAGLGFAMAVIVAIAAGESSTRVATLLRKIFSNPGLRSAGKYSYAMYIFHMPISRALAPQLLPFLRSFGSAYPLLYALTIISITYVAAAASYYLIEQHFLKLKRYFVPGKPVTAAVPG